MEETKLTCGIFGNYDRSPTKDPPQKQFLCPEAEFQDAHPTPTAQLTVVCLT